MNFIKSSLFQIIKRRRERFPELLSIELTNACNADCIMCPRNLLTRKIQNMPFDTVKKIVDDCKNQPLRKINLFWFGDSLCNKNILEYIRYIRKHLPKVKLYLSTNAELLFKERSRVIVDEQLLDIINFDIDGTQKETYESIRRKVDFDKVMENVLYFINYRKSNKKKKPQTRVTIIRMKPTESEIDDFIRFWKPRVDKVDVNDYNTWLGSQEDLNVGSRLHESQSGKFDFACIHPWEELVISADGRAGLCCLDYDLNADVGDVSVISIKEIWNGKKINFYREKLLNLRYDDISICKNCNAYIYQNKRTWAKLQK